MDTLSKVVMANGDASIERLLNAWIDVVLRYDRLHEGDDCCWWYNERANVSTLAGAAWTQTGWAALEEYSSRKAAPKTSGLDAEDKRGRVDLYIATEDTGMAFEAKHAWQDITAERLLSAVDLGMGDARDDASRLLEHEGDRFYGVTFAVPLIPPSASGLAPDREQLVRRWLDDIAGRVSSNYAYVFPRLRSECFVNSQGFTYPGVVLIIEEVKSL